MAKRDPRYYQQLASEILKSENVPADFLSYIADYTALNIPNIPAGQLMGSNYLNRMLDSDGSTLDIVNTLAETSVYTKTLGGGTLDVNGMVRVTAWGDYLNDSGAARNLTLKIKYGGTTMWADTVTSINNGATRYVWRLQADIAANAATNAQSLGGIFHLTSGTATTGLGDIVGFINGGSPPLSIASVLFGTASIDSTLNKDIDITVTHSTNNSSLSFRRYYVFLQKVAH